MHQRPVQLLGDLLMAPCDALQSILQPLMLGPGPPQLPLQVLCQRQLPSGRLLIPLC